MRTTTYTRSSGWRLPVFPKTEIRQTHGLMHAAFYSVIRYFSDEYSHFL